MKHSLLAIVASTALAAAPAYAAQRGNFYFVGNLGINMADGTTEFSRNTTLYDFDLEYDNGFDISGGLGYRHNKFLRADVQAGYAKSDFSYTNETFNGFPGNIVQSEGDSTSYTHITLNAYFDLPISHLMNFSTPSTYDVPIKSPPVTGFGIFVGGGGGIMFSDGNVGGIYQGLAGATYAFANGLNVDLGYKYVKSVDSLEVDNLYVDGPAGVQNVLYEIDYESSTVQTGMRYTF